MKYFQSIILSCILFSLLFVFAVSADNSQTSLFTEFYLQSNLGIRTLADQTTVQDQILKNSVALKSPNEAFLYSLAIPGMGQLYSGAKHGYIYTAAEVGLLVTYFLMRNSATNTREDYRQVVRDNIVFIGPGSFENWDKIEDYEHATQYENWNHVYDSEATRTRTGKWYWKDLDPSLKDAVDTSIDFDSKHRLEAYDLRQEANDTFENARTVLGLVILNHVISAVEARITTKRWNNRQLQNRSFDLELNTDVTSGSINSALIVKKRF